MMCSCELIQQEFCSPHPFGRATELSVLTLTQIMEELLFRELTVWNITFWLDVVLTSVQYCHPVPTIEYMRRCSAI